MVLERKTLLENLRLAMPGIESGNITLQGSDSFVFYEGKLFTYNDAIAVLVPIDSVGLMDNDIEGAVHAKEFYNVVSKFTNDEIEFSVTDKNTWIIKCGRAKVELTLLDFDFKTRLKGVSVDSSKWVDLPSVFMEGMQTCKMNGNKSNLEGIYVRDDKILSTDTYQVNLYTLPNKLPSFWISDSSLNELLKLKNLKKVQVNKNWVHFQTDEGVVLSVKTKNDASYPYDKIMNLINNLVPSDDDFHSKFPIALFDSIDRANNFSLELLDQNVVRLIISNDGIEVSSEKNSGNYVETIPWDSPLDREIDTIEMYVNADMMNAMSKRSLEFYFKYVEGKKSKLPRLLFVTPSSKHMIACFNKPSK